MGKGTRNNPENDHDNNKETLKMNVLFRTGAFAIALLASPFLMAEEAEVMPAGAAEPEAAAQVVDVDVTAEQVVTLNTGSEMVDTAANLAMRCTEKKVAMEACGGGFKGIACKKGLEMTKYKGLECPSI